MESKENTTIWISDETWNTLNKMKRRGESFEKVINRLIDMADFNFLHWQEIEILEELGELWKEQDYKDKYPTLFTLHNMLEANLEEIKAKRSG